MSIYIRRITLGYESPYNNVDWISDFHNSADGIGVQVEITNMDHKTVNYVQMVITPFNEVGDAVGCTTRGHVQATITATGPFKPMETKKFNFDCLWYNPTIKKVKLEAVAVKYSDGTEESFTGEQTLKAQRKALSDAEDERLKGLEKRLKEVEAGLRRVNTTDSEARWNGIKWILEASPFLLLCIVGFMFGATDSFLTTVACVILGLIGGIGVYCGISDVINPKNTASQGRNIEKNLLNEKDILQKQIKPLKEKETLRKREWNL